jgi:predicted nucleotidyltransferase
MDEKIKRLLCELKAALQSLYGDRLRGVYLYGSYAKGKADAESDVDVLIVLDTIDHYAAEVDRTGYAAAEISLRYGVSISRVFSSDRDWRRRATPFLQNAREEAVPA